MIAICVDDEVLALRMIKSEAEKSNDIDKVFTFDDEAEALEWAKTNPFDIAFLDIEMPHIDGIELAEELRKLNMNCGIVYCTGYAQYSIDAIKRRVVDGYILKPFEFEDLQKEIDNVKEKYGHGYELIIKLKNGVSVYDKNGELIVFKRKKILDICEILANTDGEIISTERLCSMIWDDSDPDLLKSKREYLWKLMGEMQSTFEKNGASDVIIKANGGYAFNMPVIKIIK